LKYYLKELEENKLAHNPDNKMIMDEKGLFKIMIKKDDGSYERVQKKKQDLGGLLALWPKDSLDRSK
jgi:hypothetical protein